MNKSIPSLGSNLKYKSLIRTTLDKTDGLPYSGIYIIAYLGKILYVGKTIDSVSVRLYQHWINRGKEDLGSWMDNIRQDWHNVRLDVLEAPDVENFDYWLRQVENLLIKKFNPLFKMNSTV